MITVGGPAMYLAKVALHDACLGVGIAAGRIVDEQRQRLVLVELRRREMLTTPALLQPMIDVSALQDPPPVVPAKAGTILRALSIVPWL